MWRRTYLLLIFVRLYFALSPSYLHPDENFQGPEVIAGRVFPYPVHLTWEFTSEHPIRSAFPLWLAYGPPMYIMRLLWEGSGQPVVPATLYWVLRTMMFTATFVLEDWAVHELVQSPRQRRTAGLLVASSYVTWTWQTHTFSNSVETLVVAWCLVLIDRIVEDKDSYAVPACTLLSFLMVLGVFNRITFPAFVLLPSLKLIPYFRRRPISLLVVIVTVLSTTFLCISVDTVFYTRLPFSFRRVFRSPVITPLNNVLYNTQTSNLAAHGLHPRWQHLVVNLPQLLGPALLLLPSSARRTPRLDAALSGVALLSVFPHQEARFLLPAVPLVLSSLRLPRVLRRRKLFLGAWVAFNITLGALMGVYHQGGVVPAQMFIASSAAAGATNTTEAAPLAIDVGRAFWWKTYSPPIWLLDGHAANTDTVDLMGARGDTVLERLREAVPCPSSWSRNLTGRKDVVLVAPRSAHFLRPYLAGKQRGGGGVGGRDGVDVTLTEVWSYRAHLNLDDMEFGDDGVMPTLRRVIGDRGIVVWRVDRVCQ